RSFLAALAGEPLEALFWLLLSTGVRKGEAIALKWDDIDLDTGRVTVRRKIVRLMGEAVIGDAKSDAGVRVVQLPATAMQKLLLWQKRQQLQKKMATNWTEGGWVFTHGSGKWVEPRWVNKKLTELLKKA